MNELFNYDQNNPGYNWVCDCLCSRSCKTRSVVAREVNFGMAVAYMILAEQRAID